VISIVLPARNERENVLAIIPEIHALLGKAEYEIILVDDQSGDGTIEAVRALELPFVETFGRQGRKGLGSAVGFGIERSRGNTVVVMDSDFNHQPKYIPQLLNALEHHACACGSRFLKGGGMSGRMHYNLSRLFNSFVRWITGGQLSDYSYGFFAVKKECLTALDSQRIFRGHGDYAIRLFFYLEKDGVAIREIPVQNGLRKFGKPNRAYVSNFYRYISEVIKLIIDQPARYAR
jgi:dolichol-phosphate mannosyltransferase